MRLRYTIDDIQELHQRIESVQALFFDFDGTLVHTDYANFVSYSAAVNQVLESGVALTYNSNERFNRSVLKRVIPNLSESKYQEIIKRKEIIYMEHLPDTKLSNAVSELLLQYSKSKTTVLVTNCRQDRASATLAHHGLADKFAHTFYRHLSENGEKINKYVNAISTLNIPPDSILVFENETSEINDAKLAGVPPGNIISPKLSDFSTKKNKR